jgi:hypothetical protein
MSLPRWALSSVLNGVSVVVVTLVQCRWQCRGVVLPVCSVKTSLGSPWLAARALPRHAIQACAWALASKPLLLYPILFSLATVSGHLAKASEPSSQIVFVQLLADTSLSCGFS